MNPINTQRIKVPAKALAIALAGVLFSPCALASNALAKASKQQSTFDKNSTVLPDGIISETVVRKTIKNTTAVGLTNTENQPAAENSGDHTATQPVLVLGAYKNSNGTLQKLADNTVHLDRPDEMICWAAYRLPAANYDRLIAEHITAPAPLVMNYPEKLVLNRANEIFMYVKLGKDDAYSDLGQCYHFGAGDPAGTYRLTVTVGDLVFEPPLEFSVAP